MKSKETYEKVAETFKKKGDRHFAQAKNGEGDEHYGLAKNAYNTAKKASDKAKTNSKGEKI